MLKNYAEKIDESDRGLKNRNLPPRRSDRALAVNLVYLAANSIRPTNLIHLIHASQNDLRLGVVGDLRSRGR